MGAPSLWITCACTITQVMILFLGFFCYSRFLAICDAANATTGKYEGIRLFLILNLYCFAPNVVISTTFAWVSYDQSWEAGYVFVWLPFTNILIFTATILATKNDISNRVDRDRDARSRLPQQPPLPPLFPTIPLDIMPPPPIPLAEQSRQGP